MTTNAAQSITPELSRSLRNYLEAMFRHRFVAAVFLLTVLVVTLVLLALLPDEYTSTAKLIVRRGRESLLLDPTAATGEVLPTYKEWESELNSELEILSSYELTEQVVQSMGARQILEPPPPDPTGMLGPLRVGLQRITRPAGKALHSLVRVFAPQAVSDEPSINTNLAAELVAKHLAIQVRHKSDILLVSYTASSPQLAQQVTEHLVARYLDARLQVRHTPGAHQFFTEQTTQLLTALQETKQELQALKNEAGIVSLNDNRQALLSRQEELQIELLRAETDRAATGAKIQRLDQTLQQESQPGNTANLRTRDSYSQLQDTLAREKTLDAALAARIETLHEQLDKTARQLERLNNYESPILNLERQRDMLEAQYRKYSENREQARINEALETQKISNVRVVQAATLPSEPEPTHKPVKLVLALLLGLIGSSGLALMLDAMNPALRRADQIVQQTGLPVLLTIPRSHRLARHPLTHSAANGSPFAQELLSFFYRIWPPHSDAAPRFTGLTSVSEHAGVTTTALLVGAEWTRHHHHHSAVYADCNPREHSPALVKHFPDKARFLSFVRENNQPIELEAFAFKSPPETQPNRAHGLVHAIRDYPCFPVLLDIPPLSLGERAVQQAAETQGIILVAEAEHTTARELSQAADLLTAAGCRLLGVILNKQKRALPKWLDRRLPPPPRSSV